MKKGEIYEGKVTEVNFPNKGKRIYFKSYRKRG